MQINVCIAFAFAFVVAVHGHHEVHHPEPETTTSLYIAEESSVQAEIEVASEAGEVVEQGNCDNGLGKCVPFYHCKHEDHHDDDGHHHGGPGGPGGNQGHGWGHGWGGHRSRRSPRGGHGGWHHGPHGKDDECKEKYECCCKIASIDLTGQPPKHLPQHWCPKTEARNCFEMICLRIKLRKYLNLRHVTDKSRKYVLEIQ